MNTSVVQLQPCHQDLVKGSSFLTMAIIVTMETAILVALLKNYSIEVSGEIRHDGMFKGGLTLKK